MFIGRIYLMRKKRERENVDPRVSYSTTTRLMMPMPALTSPTQWNGSVLIYAFPENPSTSTTVRPPSMELIVLGWDANM